MEAHLLLSPATEAKRPISGQNGSGLSLASPDLISVQNGASVVIPESLTIDNTAVVNVSPSSSLAVNGNILGPVQSPVAYNPLGTVAMSGGSATSPLLLEAMSANLGSGSIAFVNNFAYGTLALSGNSNVKLVDLSHNSTNSSPEAVYVNSLIVPAGSTLYLNGLQLFARYAQIGGTINPGTGGVFTQIPASNGTLVLGYPVPANLSQGALSEWSIYGMAGQSISAAVDPGSGLPGGPIAPTLQWAQVQIISNTSGMVIASGMDTTAGGVIALTNILLTSTGWYHIAIQAPSSNASSAGNYVVAAYDVTPSIQTLNVNEVTTGTVGNPYTFDQWTFAATANTQVQFKLLGRSAGALNFTLTGPNNFVGFNAISRNSTLVTLPGDGTYTLTAQGTGGATGSFSFSMNQTSQVPLSLGVPFTGNFAGTGQAQLFSVNVVTPGPLQLTLFDGSSADHIELYAQRGSPPTRESYGYAQNGMGANQSILIPNATEGTWYVLVYAESVASPPSSYSLDVVAREIVLGDVTPTQSASPATTTITLDGLGFAAGTVVSLVSSTGVSYAASSVAINLPTQLTATFTPNSVPAGVYSVQATLPDGSTDKLSDVFTMAANGTAVLTTNLELPSPMSRHIAETIYVDYSNTGNVAMPAPLLILDATNPMGQEGALMTLDPSLQGEGLWTNNTPAGYSQSIEILASGSTPGVLQPGESIRIPVYYAGWLNSQWDFNDDTLNFSLKVVQPDDQSAMNWTGVTYVSGIQTTQYLQVLFLETLSSSFAAAIPWINGVPPTEKQIQDDVDNGDVPLILPPGYKAPPLSIDLGTTCTISTVDNVQGIDQQPPPTISQTAWNVIAHNLTSTFGYTLGGYVTALDSEANYLGQLGLNVTDVQSLWGFAVQQADDALSPLSPYIASATDDSVAIPGSLSLDFSRVYAESVSGRDTASTLGSGWSTPWQTTATLNADMSVTINGPGGAQQLFEPDVRTSGAYFSQPGDTSTLSTDGSGGYLLTASDGTETDYTAAGLLNYMQDIDGNRITAGYTSGKLTSLNASSGQYIHIGYNGAGLIASLNDSDGRSVAYTYDSTNTWLVSVRSYNGQTTSYSYSTISGSPAQNAITTISFPGGTHQYFTYDSQGRVASTYSDGGAQPETFAYNLGEVSVTDGTSDTSSVYYNQNGQVSKSVDGLGNPTYYTYDADFNLASVTNAQGQSETYTYNSVGEATSSTDFLGNSTYFVYGGPHNELSSMTDAKGNVTQYGYDVNGDLLSTTYADSTHSNSTFNPLGEATSFINQNGQPISYTYNAAGQVSKELFSDGSSYVYTYDSNGNLLTATDATGVTTFTYDPITELMTEVQYPGGLYLKFTYNAAGQRTQMVDQTGFTTNYIYDSNGRLSELTDGSGDMVVTYTYDADGRLSKKVNGNGTYATYSYDADGNVLTLYNYAPGGAVNSSFIYTYNNLGLETTETTIDGQWVYGYDPDGQLTHAVFTPDNTNPDGLAAQNMVYNYDAEGNRTSTIINGATTRYATNDLNEYTSVGGANYTYDSDGNLLSNGVENYTYNSLNQLTGVSGSIDAAQYVYDAIGQRTGSLANGITTRYIIDPAGIGNMIERIDASGSTITHYLFALGLVSQAASGTNYYYDFDATGSTVGLSGPSAELIDKAGYLPFGGYFNVITSIPITFGFDGEIGIQEESGNLLFARARSTSPATGRFTSKDPLAAAFIESDAYLYADNNPVSLIDPSGLYTISIGGGVTGGSGGREISIQKSYVWDFSSNWPHEMITYGLGKSIGGDATAAAGVTLTTADSYGDLANGGIQGSVIAGKGFFKGTAGFTAGKNYWGIFGGGAFGASGGSITPTFTVDEGPIVDESKFIALIINTFDDLEADYDLLLDLVDRAGQLVGDFLLYIRSSFDPNALFAPSGYSPSNFIAGNQTNYPYMIQFENSDAATAPVQYLTVTDQLDPNLNWSTFQLTGIGWGNFNLMIPTGSQSYQTTVLMTENGQTFDVEVNAGIHTSTGQVYATFQAIDPTTGLPPANPLTGFLPPENNTGAGIGYLSYTVSPKANLHTGTQIRNIATINFDQGISLATDLVTDEDPSQGIDPTKQGLVTIDAGNPTSSVTALPPTENTASFNVSWGGIDDTGGSGVGSYSIYVSADGGPFLPWLMNTNATSGTYNGLPGYNYSFYSIATDNVGNVQPTPLGAQATTTVSGTAPTVLTLTGSAEYLQLDADGSHLDLWNDVSPTGSPTQYLLSSVSSIVINGASTGTYLTVDFSNGDPLVATGLTFSGMAGKTNTLNIVGTTGNDAASVNATTFTESAAFGTAIIVYSNLSGITFSGGTGTDSLTQTAQPGAPVSFVNSTLSDTLNVDAGTFAFPASTASSGITQINLGNLSVGAGAEVSIGPGISHATRSVLILNSLSLAGNAGSWTGALDLADNDLIVNNGSLATVTNEIQSGLDNGAWNGTGLNSGKAASDSTHLTALGVLLNSNGTGALFGGGTSFGLFDGVNPSSTAILVKYTYYGDANLDGAIDGSDYSRIDNGLTNHLSGWSDGDFNYSGSVDGIDYTLIDNTFNTQGSRLSNLTPTLTLPSAPTLTYDGTSDVTSWVVPILSGPTGDPAPTGSVSILYYTGTSATGTQLASAPIAPDTYTVVASYPGDTHYAAELSNAVTFTINKAQATVTLAAGPGTIKYDGTTDVTNWVKGFATGIAGAALATGTVTPVYYSGTSATGTPLASSPVSAGTYTVVGSYSGDSNYAASLSAPITFTISASTGAVPVTLTGAALYLRLDADGQHLDVWNSTTDTGSPAQSILLSTISSIAITGLSTGTTLSVDFAAGDPLVPSGSNFNGLAGASSVLRVIDTGDAGAATFTVDSGNVIVKVPSGTAPITYVNTKSINIYAGTGSETLTQNAQPGNGTTSLSYLNTTASDNLALNSGTFTVATSAAGSGITSITLGNVAISQNTTLTIAAPDVHGDRYVMTLGSLSIAGTVNAWQGQFDLTGNDLIVHTGNLVQLRNQIAEGFANGAWNGLGITSSTADSANHQTALGVELNNNGSGQPLYGSGTSMGLFDAQNPGLTDVLVKYTDYGDANLDGRVDGSDYSKIDNGYLTYGVGWANGDFNYDGTIDGSDYTLIDNAFDTQGARLAAKIADVVAEGIARLVSKNHVDVFTAITASASRSTSFTARVFSNGSPISFADSADQNLESLMENKELLDNLQTRAFLVLLARVVPHFVSLRALKESRHGSLSDQSA